MPDLSKPVEEESSRSRVPIWLPISAFIGTSVAIAIPLLMVRRQRRSLGAITRVGLNDANAATPPPRRRLVSAQDGGTSVADLRARLVARASTPTNVSLKAESPQDETSPGLGSLMTMRCFAGKAFLIATGLVTVGGGLLAWGVKTALGVNEAHEFGTKMRSFLWSAWPSLAARIHRGPEDEQERKAALEAAPFGVQEEWSTEASEARLKRAYDEGGFPLWAQTAFRELEAEARIERARRQREVDAEAAKHAS
ncbi:hypothetical protein DFP72DRAFT_1069851 [Ephemerocybe angulata]|uniref:Transmembrane protein n=1 Tax=Ephemerocybe angulata TaxID=980116 RepID=A0A8H6HWH6_9AGAR|nr:hypothetical protein DFP72DRAFT_1069851 [Tulosesus angulatus]